MWINHLSLIIPYNSNMLLSLHYFPNFPMVFKFSYIFWKALIVVVLAHTAVTAVFPLCLRILQSQIEEYDHFGSLDSVGIKSLNLTL